MTRNRIAAIKTNAEATATAEATSWNPNASTAASAVNALALSGTSIVYVGGSFTKIGSTQVTRNRIAAIKTNAEATATAEATSWNPKASSARRQRAGGFRHLDRLRRRQLHGNRQHRGGP